MEIAANLATELALSALSPLINKLASKFGSDVTDEEMEHLNVFVRYEIVALTREAKSDDLVQSMPLLEKLQAAALEVEDLLDLYEYNQIEKQVSSSSSNPIKKLIPKFKEKFGPILPKSPLRLGVEKLLKFVEQVEKKHPFITSKTGSTTQPQATTVTPKTSTLSSPFYGRGDQCDMIIKLLLDESHANLNSRTKNVPIIAIRGFGGAGKTTTAQRLYIENKIVDYFNLRMWVHVTRGFDEEKLIKEIIESAEQKACPQISNFDVLQTKLKDSISEKKFLLVLDDVWEEDTTRLDIVLSPLNQVGLKGSKIILTTRMAKAAEDLHAKPIILLDELKDEDCWSILKHYAFDNNKETIEDQELKYVGNQIISKVKHSPLALKVVGSSLSNKRSVKEWEKILQQDILKENMDLLLFSYQCLPSHLQRCFAYCSLFPKGYIFYNDRRQEPDLISLWIAQGFIENVNKLTLEEAGMNNIEELLSYSFFEKKSEYSFDIHDLVHDLAERVSKKHCHRIERYEQLYVPTTCIHLSLYIMENLVSIAPSTILAITDIFKSRNLRSLIILRHAGSTNIFKSKKDIFQNLTKLRALYVESYGQIAFQQIEVLSESGIDKLKHLRYLHLRCDSKLPISLAKLYQLQFFILITNRKDSAGYLLANTLPDGFSNLINLRILQFCKTYGGELNYMYYNSEKINIEKLTTLQNLKSFYVDGLNRMVSLRNLPLCGSLSIRNLENVKCKMEAEEAMLNKKENLDDLIFEWSCISNNIDTCEEVLEGLEPHRNLEKLKIKCYQGVKFPKWMVKENWLPRLQILELESCKSLKIVPILPPRLQVLYIFKCDELMQLPPLSDTLERLELEGLLNLLALTNLSPALTSLNIEDCPKLTSLGNSHRCTSLNWLIIIKCPMLKREEASLVEGVVEGDIANRLPHVKYIHTDAPSLVVDLVQQQAFSSIRRLDLRDCAVLPNLEKLSSLYSLFIIDCPDVELLPNLPVSLQLLEIDGCPKLKEKYEEGGPLRNTISHIPQIYIDWKCT